MVSKTGSASTVSAQEIAIFKNASDSEFQFRRLEWGDFDKGFLEALKGLTVVGDITKQEFGVRFDEIFPRLSDLYKIIVVEDLRKGKIVGAGTLLVELKFLRHLGKCGHIEDIVVDKN